MLGGYLVDDRPLLPRCFTGGMEGGGRAVRTESLVDIGDRQLTGRLYSFAECPRRLGHGTDAAVRSQGKANYKLLDRMFPAELGNLRDGRGLIGTSDSRQGER